MNWKQTELVASQTVLASGVGRQNFPHPAQVASPRGALDLPPNALHAEVATLCPSFACERTPMSPSVGRVDTAIPEWLRALE